jgi:protein subunit release factor B
MTYLLIMKLFRAYRGGQKINKVRNCVQLTHIPTGVTVRCQETRSLTSNRAIARKWLDEKVEHFRTPTESKIGNRIAKVKRNKARNARRAKQKALVLNSNAAGGESDG